MIRSPYKGFLDSGKGIPIVFVIPLSMILLNPGPSLGQDLWSLSAVRTSSMYPYITPAPHPPMHLTSSPLPTITTNHH